MSSQQRRWLLSGGIGGGKSETRRILEDQGVKTIDADSVGHSILEPGGVAFDAVSARWSEAVVEGRIDRAKLGRIVFADEDELADLELITHPLIFGTIIPDVERFEGPVVVEVPVLTDALGGAWARIVVDAPEEIRTDRSIARGLTEQDVRGRMARQPSRAEWLAAADLVIPNAGSLAQLERTVRRALPTISGS